MLPEEAKTVAENQRRRSNELVDVFDRPQPAEVMARLWEIVASAELCPGAVVLDVGTGAGVLIPLIQSCWPSTVSACDVAEKMLQWIDGLPGALDIDRTGYANALPGNGPFPLFFSP